MTLRFARLNLAAALMLGAAALPAMPARADEPAAEASDSGAPKINFAASPAIVKYQLKRLDNAHLAAVERKPEAKYKPLYAALLARKGIDRKYRQEAIDALAKINGTDPVVETLEGIGALDPEDKGTRRDLIAILAGQKAEALKAQREKIASLATDSDNPAIKQVAYAALAVADGGPDEAWKLALSKPDGLKALLGGLQTIADPKLREKFYPLVKPLVEQAPDDETRIAAIEALSYLPGHEAEAFGLLAKIVEQGSGDIRAAAVRSIQRIPAAKWPKDQLAAVAKAAVKILAAMPLADRTTPTGAETMQLGYDAAGALPPADGAPIRKELRNVGVRTVVIHTLREQVMYDLHYFTVEAGKPVQVVLDNTDNMPHNFVLTMPGKMMDVVNAGAAIAPSGEPDQKAYVPATPDVVDATVLVQPDEKGSISFNAPKAPGEYPFVCSFPSHAERMHGTMLVVADIDAWDQSPKPPADPVSKKPYETAKATSEGAPPPPAMHEHH